MRFPLRGLLYPSNNRQVIKYCLLFYRDFPDCQVTLLTTIHAQYNKPFQGGLVLHSLKTPSSAPFSDYNEDMLQTPRVSPYSSYIIGFKLDAEAVNIVYGSQSGIISERIRFVFDPTQSFQSFLAMVSQHSDKLLNIVQAQHLPLPELASLSVTGSYNAPQGLLVSSRDFPAWKNETIKSQFQLLFNLPIYIEKHAKAGAIAEMLFGAAQESKDFSFLDMGTSLSLANIINGQLQAPSNAHAGAIGRLRLPSLKTHPDDPAPTLNEFCSASGIVAQALRKQAAHWDPETTIYQIINAAQNDDPYAIELLAEAGTILGQSLAPYIHLMRQEMIILGFPLCLAGSLFSEPVFKAAQAATGLGLDEMPKILASPLANRLPELQALAPAIHAVRNQTKP